MFPSFIGCESMPVVSPVPVCEILKLLLDQDVFRAKSGMLEQHAVQDHPPKTTRPCSQGGTFQDDRCRSEWHCLDFRPCRNGQDNTCFRIRRSASSALSVVPAGQRRYRDPDVFLLPELGLEAQPSPTARSTASPDSRVHGTDRTVHPALL